MEHTSSGYDLGWMSTEVNMIWPTLIDLDAIAGLGALVGSTATVRSETEISAGFPQNIYFISSDNFSHSLKQRIMKLIKYTTGLITIK